MTSFRARLPWQDGFPKNELHAFHLGKIVGFCYSINKGNYVWSMAVPDTLLHSLEGQDGDKTAEGKENACNVIKANSLQASQSCLECPSHECCPVQSLARCTVTNCKQEPNQRFEGIGQLLFMAVMSSRCCARRSTTSPCSAELHSLPQFAPENNLISTASAQANGEIVANLPT